MALFRCSSGGGGGNAITVLVNESIAKGVTKTVTVDLSKRYLINFAQLRADRNAMNIYKLDSGTVTSISTGNNVYCTVTLSGTTLSIKNTHSSDAAFYSVVEV